MNTAATMASDAELVKKALAGVEMLQKQLGDVNSDGKPFKAKSHDKVLRLTVYESEVPGAPMKRWKGVIELPLPLEVVLKCIKDNSLRAVWDSSIHEMASTPLGDNVEILHTVTKAVFAVSSREFLDASATVRLPNGCVAHGGEGVSSDARYPDTPGAVRGHNGPGGGWYLEPIARPADAAGDAAAATEWCRVHYVIFSDLRGWLPTAIVNSAMVGAYGKFFGDMSEYLKHHKVSA